MDTKIRTLLLTSFAHFSNDGNTYVYPFLLTYYVLIPSANLAILGGLSIIYQIVNGFLSTPMGAYIDKVGRYHVFLSLGIFLQGVAVAIFVTPFILPSLMYPSLAIAAVILGVGQTFYHPVGASMIKQTFGKESAPKMLGFNGSFGSLGRAIMPAVLIVSISIFGMEYGIEVDAAYMLAASLIILIGLRFYKGTASPRQRKSGEIANSVSEDDFQDKTDRGKYRRFLILLTSAVFLRSMLTRGIATYVPLYVEILTGSKSIMTVIITAGLLMSAFGQPIFGSITASRGGKFTTILTTATAMICFAVFLLTGLNVFILGAAYCLFAFFNFSGFSIFLGYVSQVVPDRISTTANSMVWGGGQILGGAAGIGIVSLLIFYSFSLADTFWIMFVFGIASLALLPMLPGRTKPGSRAQPA